jgi:hypothetical protein
LSISEVIQNRRRGQAEESKIKEERIEPDIKRKENQRRTDEADDEWKHAAMASEREEVPQRGDGYHGLKQNEDPAFKRAKNSKTKRRSYHCQHWETGWACSGCNHSTDGPDFFYDFAFQLVVAKCAAKFES